MPPAISNHAQLPLIAYLHSSLGRGAVVEDVLALEVGSEICERVESGLAASPPAEAVAEQRVLAAFVAIAGRRGTHAVAVAVALLLLQPVGVPFDCLLKGFVDSKFRDFFLFFRKPAV